MGTGPVGRDAGEAGAAARGATTVGATVTEGVRRAYGRWAPEYTDLFGDVTKLAVEDRDLIRAWGRAVAGPVLDAGCGPGHWTSFLQEQGCVVEGLDLVEEFVAGAARRFPGVRFRTGTLEALPAADAALGGLLSWYSIIHTPPATVPAVLAEFARCLRPGGSLLLGFCSGERLEPFDHRVVTAYFWPVTSISGQLAAAGFEVVETHTRTDPGRRPHAAVVARRRDG